MKGVCNACFHWAWWLLLLFCLYDSGEGQGKRKTTGIFIVLHVYRLQFNVDYVLSEIFDEEYTKNRSYD